MTDPVVKEPLWVGRVEPVEDTPFNRDYWCTPLTASAIGAKYGIHGNQTGRRASPANVIGLKCRECSAQIGVNNRTEAVTLLQYLAQDYGWSAHRWKRMACSDCQKKERLADEIKRLDYIKSVREDAQGVERGQERIEYLRSIPYDEYLNTPEWRDCRARALKRAGYACQVCYSNGYLHVHHRTYRNRGNEMDMDLTVLCAECHELFHDRMVLAEKRGRAA